MAEIEFVKKANGEMEEFSWDKIETFYKRVCHGLNTKCPYKELQGNFKNYLIEEMDTKDITFLIIKSAIDLISTSNTSWQFIASRMMTKNIYKDWSRVTGYKSSDVYAPEYLEELVSLYSEEGLYNERIIKTYSTADMLELGKYIKPTTDFGYTQATVQMYMEKYLLNRKKLGVRELPQHMYMVNAMFLGMNEKPEDRMKYVKDVYDVTSQGELSLPTPTLMNARTTNSQLSSCFILTVADDLRSIYHAYDKMAQISKNGGGLGVYMGNIRARGSTIQGVEGLANGVVPWVKIINNTAIAVDQLGARKGAISVTLDVFHADIYDWLGMQTETGDIRGKSFDIFPAIAIPDLFMERMEANEEWSMFCPKEIEDKYGKRLQDHFGEDFNAFYKILEADEELSIKPRVKAKELFKHHMKAVVETGMPYVFFRDTVNAVNPNKHAGNIYCTNLCTEIAQNQSEDTFICEEEKDGVITTKTQSGDTVICNLASINLGKVNTPEQIARVVPIAMRTLDNVIDLNAFPLEETRISAEKYRAVGLGMMGLAQYFAEAGLFYGSPESVEATDVLFRNLAYETLRSSVDLAKERGAYPAFEGSEYSKGIAFGKQIGRNDILEGGGHKWRDLEGDMIKNGTRFGYHSSPAPNTSTGLVVGTTAGLVPIYQKYFVENGKSPKVSCAPNLNAENFWNYPEMTTIDLNTVIDVIATAQKWIDQSVSFEWLINPKETSPVDMYNYYFKAWRAGIKTVYYVRSMSLTTDDCVSCSG